MSTNTNNLDAEITDFDVSVQAAWDREAKRRLDDIRSGKAELIQGEEVFTSLYAQFQ
jgi:Putative addiction module component